MERNGNNDGTYSFVFFGGEPLLRFDIIKELVEYGRQNFKDNPGGLSFGITTNGSLLDNEIIMFFKKNRIAPLISIDGHQEVNDVYRKFKNGTGTFKEIAKNLELARELNLPFGARITITNACPNVKKLIDELDYLGFFSYIVALVDGDDRMALDKRQMDMLKESYQDLAVAFVQSIKEGRPFYIRDFDYYIKLILKKAPKRLGCNMGISAVSVNYKGEVFSCYKLVGESEALMGSIFDEQITSYRPGLDYSDNVAQIKGCNRCNIREICGGGCFADQFLSRKYNQYKNYEDNCELTWWKFLLSIWIISNFKNDELDKL